jgi:hypothetical protein
MSASQTEFRMSVAVCAWCKPKEQHESFGLLSHGICLRHLRKMKLEAQGIVLKRTGRPLPASEIKLEPLLLPLTLQKST